MVETKGKERGENRPTEEAKITDAVIDQVGAGVTLIKKRAQNRPLTAKGPRQRNVGAQVDGGDHPGNPLDWEAEQEQPDNEKRFPHHTGDENAAGHDHAEDGVGPCERSDSVPPGHANEDTGEEMPAVPAEVQAERGGNSLADAGRDKDPGGQRAPRAHEHGNLLFSRKQDVGQEKPQRSEHGPWSPT